MSAKLLFENIMKRDHLGDHNKKGSVLWWYYMDWRGWECDGSDQPSGSIQEFFLTNQGRLVWES
jgi:hypothetical protein